VSNPLVRDAFEGMIILGLGGMLFSAIRKLVRREISVNMCNACGRPCSRAYPACTKCGTLQAR
jgi:hypothetical protein